jgi:hypothetical protein
MKKGCTGAQFEINTARDTSMRMDAAQREENEWRNALMGSRILPRLFVDRPNIPYNFLTASGFNRM